jgi:acetyl esterase
VTPAERAQAAAFRMLAGLPARAKRAIAGPPETKDGNTLDLDAQLVVRLERMNPRPPVEERGHVLGREDLLTSTRMVAGPPVELRKVHDATVAGRPARLYVPHDARDTLVLFFHGGGWTVGDIDSHDSPCRALAKAAGMPVMSVDYPLAPEHPWPEPLDHALAAFDEAQQHHERIVVAGDSAGGHLAAMVALRRPAAFQLLIYPATDFTHTYESERLFAEGYLLTKRNMDFYEAQFVPDAADKRAASPLHADDLAQAPPAMVVTAGFDPLRDEGEAYAAKLEQAGVRTILRRHPGQVHGFLNMTALPSTREAIAEMAGVLRASV